MNLNRRLARLEQSLIPKQHDLGPPCGSCGAPESTIVYEGIHMRLVPDEDDDPTCIECGRALDRESGRPIYARKIVRIVRAKPPEGWEPRTYCPD